MTEKLKDQVNIPVWLIISILAMVIPFTMFTTAQIRAQQNTATKIEILQQDMKKKADQKDVDRIYLILDRIETKLDRQIENQKK